MCAHEFVPGSGQELQHPAGAGQRWRRELGAQDRHDWTVAQQRLEDLELGPFGAHFEQVDVIVLP